MNSVSPAATQYGSPEGRRRRNLSGRHDPPQMGYQGAGRDRATDEVDKIKSKLQTAWNSVKYGWTVKMKTQFSRSSPLYLLSKHYYFGYEDDIEQFQRDFVSRVWLTYRRDFPPLEGTQLTTDCGWGCMIRSAQMMLAQALLMHLLNRDWSWPEALNTLFVEMEPLRSSSPHSLHSFSSISSPVSPSSHLYRRSTSCPSKPHVRDPHQELIHRDILRWLSDCPDAPFGLHHLVKLGGSLGKKAGDWYGPSIVAHIVRSHIYVPDLPLLGGIQPLICVLRKALETSPQVPELSVYVSQDCTVYRADVEQLLGTDGPVTDMSNTGRAVIILIPVRLGGESFNPVYKQCIKTFHCNSPRKMSIVKMDPSCTIAFYARNQADFGVLCDHVTKVLSSPSAEEKYPVFSISDGHAQEFYAPEVLPRSSYPLAHRSRGAMAKRPSSDEFEFL
ncbi:cysteine protease ATG4D isoform X3 [Dendrobates tinctorius]|uniref:cysteine protease ATG4D isoform X3 n=1 Tax=Dendrobates tinctorius TaxID=92724 RepID=UPI003CC92FA5